MKIVSVADHTSGKYYCTTLEVTLADGRTVEVDLSSSDPEPSDWEIAQWRGGRTDFNENNCDGHYEREATRFVANLILALAPNRTSGAA